MTTRPIPGLTFTIDFYDSSDNCIATSAIEAPGYWEACLHGHAILFDGSVAGAVEFDLTEQRIAA